MNPSEQEQLRFLVNIQRLLVEGNFVATYKYALLLALADIAVEKGDDSGRPLSISTADIADKYIQYYWPQARQYPGRTNEVLWQNSDRQAAIIRLVAGARAEVQGSLPRLRADRPRWQRLVRKVAVVVEKMPLWRLQVIGKKEVFPFLYDHPDGGGHTITLKPGVAYCLRRFHDLLVDLVQGAWLRYVRRLDKNQPILGQATDLAEFLFGSDRADLSRFVPVLLDVQQERCFYCQRSLRGEHAHVDHFIPWGLYPTDLGHNFVLAHGTCNTSKRDHIAAAEHLERWCTRNEVQGVHLARELERKSMPCDLAASAQITRWAYERVEAVKAMVWRRRDEMVPLDPGWRRLPRMGMLWAVPPPVHQGEGQGPPRRRIRSYPTLVAAAGAAREPQAEAPEGMEIELPVARTGPEFFAVRATGDSMDGGKNPIRDGDWLIMRYTDGAELGALRNEIALVQVSDKSGDDAYQIKRIIEKDGRWLLSSDNAVHPSYEATPGMRPIATLIQVITPR